jgi:hypothetical protein
VKRTLPFHLLFALAACSLLASAAFATTRCGDDPESCVKSASKASRPAVQLATNSTHAPSTTVTTSAPALKPAPPVVAPVTKKPAAKPQRVAPRTTSPTPGMGMLLKLSNGSGGEISWTPGKTSDTPGQSWVL